jgi:phosphoribosylanthranilate isomerase
MFAIKICGVTRAADAAAVAAAGGDAIGLNFFPGSPRAVTVDAARQIAASLPDSLVTVGVFVNSDAERIASVAAAVHLDWVQLHGQEPATLLAQLPHSLPILRAFRLRNGDAAPVANHLEACRRAGRLPDAILVDAFDERAYGGTGKTLPWESLRDHRFLELGLPVVLAGGLTPANVGQAIAAAGKIVTAVDAASGVERSPGIKDGQRVSSFVRAAAAALGANRGSASAGG